MTDNLPQRPTTSSHSHLLVAALLVVSVLDEELGLLGNGLLGGFGDEGVDENIDDLQRGISEGDDDEDFRADEAGVAQLQGRRVEGRVGCALDCGGEDRGGKGKMMVRREKWTGDGCTMG